MTLEQQEDARHWRLECSFEWGYVLTGEFIHWCPEWDSMPIDETVKEYRVCTCDKDAVLTRAKEIKAALATYPEKGVE